MHHLSRHPTGFVQNFRPRVERNVQMSLCARWTHLIEKCVAQLAVALAEEKAELAHVDMKATLLEAGLKLFGKHPNLWPPTLETVFYSARLPWSAGGGGGGQGVVT